MLYLTDIPLPSAKDREELIRLSMSGVLLADDVDIVALAASTEGYSGADISLVCRDGMTAARARLCSASVLHLMLLQLQ